MASATAVHRTFRERLRIGLLTLWLPIVLLSLFPVIVVAGGLTNAVLVMSSTLAATAVFHSTLTLKADQEARAQHFKAKLTLVQISLLSTLMVIVLTVYPILSGDITGLRVIGGIAAALYTCFAALTAARLYRSSDRWKASHGGNEAAKSHHGRKLHH